jgi:nucleoside-diphosphate-sugar epimerase
MRDLKRVLITGSSGFLGSSAATMIREMGWEVLRFSPDLKDGSAVKSFIESSGTLDFVLHFASISHPGTCEKDPGEAFLVNTLGTLNLLEAVRGLKNKPHFVFFSTAQVYGTFDRPINESDDKQPLTVYARSKLNAEKIVENYSASDAIRSTIFRLFNHSHVNQQNLYFLPSLHEKIRNAHPDEGSEIEVGDLNLVRDFSSIVDFQNNLRNFLKADSQSTGLQILNWCSGRAYSLEKLADALAKKLNKSVKWKQNPKLITAETPKMIVGNSSKISEKYSFHVTHQTEEEYVEQFLK